MNKFLLLLALVIILSGFGYGEIHASSILDEDGIVLLAQETGTRVIGSNPPPVATGSNPPAEIPTLNNPLKANSITDLLLKMVDVAIFIGVIIAVFMFIFIGFKFVWAQGNETALKQAKEWFLYAVIGTAILISSKVIVEVIKNTFISAGVVKQEQFREP